MNLNDYIKVVNNYPKKGISFKDITPILQNPEAFNYVIDELSKFVNEVNADVIVAPEARGFLFGTPVACKTNKSFIPVRKPNKLPRETISYTYQLEYGSDTLCMHLDAIKKGDKVVIIDDLVALGGTIDAIIALVEKLGGEVVGIGCVIALTGLPGITKFNDKCKFKSLLQLSDEVE